MGGYTPVFGTVFDGSLCGRWPHTGVWVSLLALADRHGHIDMVPRAIASKLGISVEELSKCIADFCAPDPDSRTQDFEGRRLELIDPKRPWGWRILNHGQYREKARLAARDSDRVASGENRERMRARRGDHRRPPVTPADPLSDSDSDSSSSSESSSSPTPTSISTPTPPAPASGADARGALELPMKTVRTPRHTLAARRGWPAAQRAASELGGRSWGDLRPSSKLEGMATRACRAEKDDSGVTLERLVRGAFAWWTRNLPAKSENTPESLLEPRRVLAPDRREEWLAAYAELVAGVPSGSPTEISDVHERERLRSMAERLRK